MRQISHYNLIGLVISLLLTLLYGCKQTPQFPDNFEEDYSESISIAYLKSFCRGSSHIINTSHYIEGYITANDLYNEFYKSIHIQDESSGIELLIDDNRLYRDYAVGDAVRLYCSGLALGESSGVISIGAPPESDFVLDYIPREQAYSRLKHLDELPWRVELITCSISELNTSDIGKLVILHEVEFADNNESLCWCDYSVEEQRYVSSSRKIVDSRCDSLTIYTLHCCSYANEPLPRGKGSICGILSYFNREFQLRVVNRQFLFQ